MRSQTKTAEKKTKSFKYYSSIFFNLLALAVLLTAIVVLHQILKKPKTSEEVPIKSMAALPDTKTTSDAKPATVKEKVAVVDLEAVTKEKKPPKKMKAKKVTWKRVKKKSRWQSSWG